MGHRRDRSALAHQRDVLGAGAEVEVGADEAVRRRAEQADALAIDVEVEAGGGQFRGLGEVVAHVDAGVLQQLEHDAVGERDPRGEQPEAAPGGLEGLHDGVMQDRVELGGEPAVARCEQ